MDEEEDYGEGEEAYGPVDVAEMGVILVPGNNEDERVTYAQKLYNNFGFFILTFKCTEGVEAGSAIAFGTLTDYECYDINLYHTIADIIYHPSFFQLFEDKERLSAFESYPQFRDIFDSPKDNKWQNIAEFLVGWLEIEGNLRNQSSIVIRQIILYLKAMLSILQFKCDNDVEKWGTDAVVIAAAKKIIEVTGSIPLIESPGLSFQEYFIGFREKPKELRWCYASNIVTKILRKMELIYQSFGKGASEQGLTITSSIGREIKEVAPALTQQPGSYSVRLQQEQGPWATGEPASPRSRYLTRR